MNINLCSNCVYHDVYYWVDKNENKKYFLLLGTYGIGDNINYCRRYFNYLYTLFRILLFLLHL